MRNSLPRSPVVGLAALASLAQAYPPNPHFRGVGDLAGGAFMSRAFDVEYHRSIVCCPADITVVGESEGADGVRAFRWTPSTGIQSLGVLEPGHTFSTARDASWHGWDYTPIVGASGASPAETRAFRWHSGAMSPVAPLAGGGTALIATALREDTGELCVGQASAPSGLKGFYTASGGILLPSLGGAPEESAALDVTYNGNRVVGYSRDTSGNIQAYFWVQSSGIVQPLGFLNTTGSMESRARGVDTIALYIVGESTSPNGPIEAFLWRPQSGLMEGLGDLPGGAFRSAALAVNKPHFSTPLPHPLVVVGWSEAADGERAFIWTEPAGMRDLKTVLEGSGYAIGAWDLQSATGVSSGGKAIAGIGINPQGETEGWVAFASCYADCNGDLKKSVADFTCFQTRFAQGDMYADCNESGTLTVADFSCFQTAYISTVNCDEY